MTNQNSHSSLYLHLPFLCVHVCAVVLYVWIPINEKRALNRNVYVWCVTQHSQLALCRSSSLDEKLLNLFIITIVVLLKVYCRDQEERTERREWVIERKWGEQLNDLTTDRARKVECLMNTEEELLLFTSLLPVIVEWLPHSWSQGETFSLSNSQC